MSFGDHFWALLGLYSTSILTYCLAGMHWVRRLSTRNCLSSSVLLLGCQCGAWFVIALPPPNSVVRESAIVHIYFTVVMYSILTVCKMHDCMYSSVVVWNYLTRFLPSLSSLPSFLPVLTLPYPLLSPLTLPCPSPLTERCPTPSSPFTLAYAMP